MSKDTIALWHQIDVVQVPKDAKSIKQMVAYAKQLAPRELTQVIKAFEAGSYEMGTSFVWQKTMSGLKRKLGALGMDFIGEMLERRDITDSSNPQQVLTDHDALRLAEELGFFPSSHTLRLRHSMEVITHFADPPSDADTDGMMPEEATAALRTCIQTVLGHPETEGAIQFAEFRRKLEVRDFQPSDPEVQTLAASPYFFRRTTLRVLLAVIKTANGASLEHVLANLNAFLPAIWDDLLHPDRQSVGWCYAEVLAEGKQTAAAGVRASLLKVKGFDYVPETLRSRTFVETAYKLTEAHHGWGNFGTEPAPMRLLESLGTSIPTPALAKCMSAVLCVWLGKPWGFSWKAAEIAERILSGVSPDRWEYYINECLPADDAILGKLAERPLAKRFIELVGKYELHSIATRRPQVTNLMARAVEQNEAGVATTATNMFNALRK